MHTTSLYYVIRESALRGGFSALVILATASASATDHERPCSIAGASSLTDEASEKAKLYGNLDGSPPGKVARLARASTTGAVVLDRDGDGASEIFAHKNQGARNSSEFWSFSTTSRTNENKTFSEGSPAPADYDGDGKADYATVSIRNSRAVWTIEKSSTGETVTDRSQDGVSRAIYGCRFVSGSKYSLATVKGRSILARELGSDQDIRIGVLPENFKRLLGCGDLQGDGTDDIIFTYPQRNSDLEIVATLGCKNQVIPYRSIKSFKSGGIVQLAKDDFPLLVTLRSLDARRDIVTLQSTAELFPYPKFFFTKRTVFTSGRYRSTDGVTEGFGLAYEDGDGKLLARIFNAAVPRPEEVTEIPTGFSLVAPQGVVR